MKRTTLPWEQILKYLFLFWVGASVYLEVELLFRGYSYWEMFFLGGVCFIACGLLNNVLPWHWSLITQGVIGTLIITLLEFIVGFVSKYCFDYLMWDYSNMPLNILGIVCVPFMIAWFPLAIIAIVVDDLIRWKFFCEQKPHYCIFTHKNCKE